MSNTSTGPRHSRALLEALFQSPKQIASPARRGSAASIRSNSGLASAGLAFKPSKPSSLAASASGQSSDEEEEDGEGKTSKEHSEALAAQVLKSTEEDEETRPPLSSSESSAGSSHKSPIDEVWPADDTLGALHSQEEHGEGDPISDILSVLQDDSIDEEDKIDETRSRLEKWINRFVARTPSSNKFLGTKQLDSLVLDLLHRYREDTQPSGRSFPAPSSIVTLLASSASESSTSRRPPSLRSISSSNPARPWTPTRFGSALGSASSATGTFPGVPTSPGSSRPGTPTRSGTPTLHGLASDADPVVRPASRSSVNSSTPGAPHTLSPLPASATSNAAGVIGSGSPRGSPLLWNRPLPGSSSQVNMLSASPSSASSSGALYAAAIGASGSRSQSPAPLSSPRLNVAAVEFRPGSALNSASSTHSSPLARHMQPLAAPMAVPSPPWVTSSAPSSHTSSSLGSNAASSSLSAGNEGAWQKPWLGSQAAQASGNDGEEDEDEDEFSPFASGKQEPAGRNFYGSSNSGASDAGRSEGDMDVFDPNFMQINPEATMTPFDILCSILIGDSAEGDPAAKGHSWTPEQVEEALSQHNWDVDATLQAVMANDGQPLPPPPPPERPVPAGPGGIVLQPRGEAIPASVSLNPKLYFTPGQKGHARGGASGVAVMSSDAFLASKSSGPSGPVPLVGPGRPGPPGSIPSSSSLRAPVPAAPGQAGAVGASRVCRYYLAGECRRADCRFSHDLGRALCRFWLKGQCLNDPCSFLHDYDVVNSLASGLAGSATLSHRDESYAQENPLAAGDDFPSLGNTPDGPGAGPSRSSGWSAPPKFGAEQDPTRTRFAQALQRKNVPPAVAALQAGDRAFVPMHPRNAPTTPQAPAGSAAAIPNGPRAASRIALRAPTLLPTLSVGRDAFKNYMNHRGSALQLSEQRNRALAKASEAWKRGDGASARAWSETGSTLNAQLAEESRVAAEALLRERHANLRERLLNTGSDGGGWGSGASVSDEAGAKGMRGKIVGSGLGVCLGVARKEAVPGGKKLDAEERAECLLDLHGLHSKEAVELVELFLLGLERENLRGLAYLAVGKGQHSSTSTDRRHIRLGSQVKSFLASWAYPYADFEGVIIVDPLTHQ